MVALLTYKDMFEYFKSERTKLIEALRKLPKEELTRNRGLSFDSIKEILAHTIMYEDTWLHYRLPGVGEITKWKLEDFKNLDDIKRYMREIDAKTEKLFDGITNEDLRKKVKRVRSDGTEEVYELEQVLFQLAIESIHHFGEIMGEFWKMKIDAPYYSYLAYIRDRKMGQVSAS